MCGSSSALRAAAPHLFLLAALGCGAPTSDTAADAGGTSLDAGDPPALPDAGRPPVPIEAWCDTWALERCRRDVRCGRLGEQEEPSCLWRERAACDATALLRGVAENRLQFLSSEAARCLDGYAVGSCFGDPEACALVFQGLVSAGEACVIEAECSVGSYCLTAEPVCPHRCHAYRALGETCNGWDAQCDPSAGHCALGDGGYVCSPLGGPQSPCSSDAMCRAELACIGGGCVQRLAKLGEPCGTTNGFPLCEATAFCVPQNGSSTAGACQRRVGVGGACVNGQGCLPNLRCSSLYRTGTCLPLATRGEKCTHSGECQRELHCRAKSATCEPLPADGGDCGFTGSQFRCAAGHYCDFLSGPSDYRCRALEPNGQECAYDGVCQTNDCGLGQLPDGGAGYRCQPPCSERADGGF